MADIADKANDQAQLILDKQIEIAKGAKLDIFPNESGQCWYCDEPVEGGKRWCESSCRDLYEQQMGK